MNTKRFWFTAGYNARMRFQENEPPICIDCKERDYWESGWAACEQEIFSSVGESNE